MAEYYLFNKPRGCITARRDARHKTVMDYFPPEKRDVLFPVGRLDRDTEGLLIITDDGRLPELLSKPERHVPKTYYFWASGELSDSVRREIEEGITPFSNSDYVTAPAKVTLDRAATLGDIEPLLSPVDKRKLERRRSSPVFSGFITLTEGKKHQVKRMIGYGGCKVLYLQRVSIGGITLDGSLPLAEYREMSEQELAALLSKSL